MTWARASVALDFDDGPVRRRIGLVALATDLTIEADFAAVTGSGAVGVFTTRIAYDNPVTARTLQAMAPRLADAARLILPGERLDAVAFGCTAASAEIGDTAVAAALTAGRPDVPTATPTSALRAACAALGVHRLAVLAPYTEEVSLGLAGYLARCGLEVVGLAWLGVADDRAIAKIRPDVVEAAAAGAMVEGAQALFCSCTALRAAPLAARLEARLGVPVLTSNQVLLWHTLKSAGADVPFPFSTRLP